MRTRPLTRTSWVPRATLARLLLVAGVVLVTGCAGPGELAGEAIPTVPDATAPPVPELTIDDTAVSPQPAPSPAASAQVPSPPDPTVSAPADPPADSPADPPTDPPPRPEDPEAFGRQAGIAGIRDAVASAPDEVGSRGGDLVDELDRVMDRTTRQRIDQASRRIERWAEQGDLDGEVATAALAALDEARDDTSRSRGNDDDDDDEDD